MSTIIKVFAWNPQTTEYDVLVQEMSWNDWDVFYHEKRNVYDLKDLSFTSPTRLIVFLKPKVTR